jgi:putative transposase
MSRKPRELSTNFCYHVTVRCNNREFKLISREAKEVFLYVLKKAIEKFNFKLYALCIMSNHIHYLIEPQQPEHLPKIMQWINWYTAMCFNRMLNRCGHFWEKRYHSTGFPIKSLHGIRRGIILLCPLPSCSINYQRSPALSVQFHH